MLRIAETLKRKLGLANTVDVYFLFLRLLTIIGGMAWYLIVPYDADRREILAWLLVIYGIYSYLLYAGISRWPKAIRGFYLTTLGVDLIFVSILIRFVGQLSGSFFIAFYLLVAIHSFYFGFRIGLLAAALSSAFYLGIYFDLAGFVIFPWTDFLLRITFLFLIAFSLGLLTEREKLMRKRVEELNRELARKNSILEQTYRHLSIGKLIGDVAEGINGPCGIMAARCELLMQDAKEKCLPEEFVRGLEVISKCSYQVSQVIRSLLTFSKQKGFDMKPIDLNEVIGETLVLMEEIFKGKGVIVRNELATNLPLVQGDAGELKGVLINLISNAMDAVSQGGIIGISTQLSSKENGNEVICTITDNGTGIRAENLEKIFNPFFTTKNKTGGIGLGLSSSLSVIKKHNGLIKVESRLGEGSAFSFFLPS